VVADTKKVVRKVAKAVRSNSPLPSSAPFWLGFSQKVGGEGPPMGEGRGFGGKRDEKTDSSHTSNRLFGRASESGRTGLKCDSTSLAEFCKAIGCTESHADDRAPSCPDSGTDRNTDTDCAR
jgi:hypothetical protein